MPFKPTELLESGTQLPYALLEPSAGPPELGAARPMIMFLHGTGERGTGVATLRRLFVHSLPWLAESDRLPATVAGVPFPFLIACPQIDRGGWIDHAQGVVGLVDELCARRGADPARCSLTGISLGGVGCWDLAASAPGRFAAIVPMSGRVHITDATAGAPPAWVFQGTDDELVSPTEAKEALDAHPDRPLTRRTFEAGAHSGDVWNRFYSRPDLYDWMLARRAQVSSD